MYKLLIVDDERHIVNYLAQLFADNTSLDVDVYKAYSGYEALAVMAKVKTDIVLLDIQIPGISGLDVAKKIQATWKNCRILFLSAYDNFEYIYKANRINSSKYILKTEKDEVIISEVKSLLDELEKEKTDYEMMSLSTQRELLFTNLLQQNVLKRILTGADIDQLCTQFQLASTNFVLDTSLPVYLIYMHIQSPFYNNGIRQIDHDLNYLQFMKQSLSDKFVFSMVETETNNYIWFIQLLSGNTDVSVLPILKGAMEDIQSLCQTQLHQNAITVAYKDSVLWSDICSVYHILQFYSDKLILRRGQATSFSAVFDSSDYNKEDENPETPYFDFEASCHILSFNLYQED